MLQEVAEIWTSELFKYFSPRTVFGFIALVRRAEGGVNQVSLRLLRRVHRVRRRVEEGGREACGPQACVQPRRRSYAKFCGEWSESGGRTREAATEFLVLHSAVVDVLPATRSQTRYECALARDTKARSTWLY